MLCTYLLLDHDFLKGWKHVFFYYSFYLFIFWPCYTACGILVLQAGIEPVPPAVEAQSPNHWIAREFPRKHVLIIFVYSISQ